MKNFLFLFILLLSLNSCTNVEYRRSDDFIKEIKCDGEEKITTGHIKDWYNDDNGGTTVYIYLKNNETYSVIRIPSTSEVEIYRGPRRFDILFGPRPNNMNKYIQK